MKKQILAVQIKDNELFAVKTDDNETITKDNLILDISLNGIEYFIIIDGVEKKFKVSENGASIEEPPIQELTQAIAF